MEKYKGHSSGKVDHLQTLQTHIYYMRVQVSYITFNVILQIIQNKSYYPLGIVKCCCGIVKQNRIKSKSSLTLI